MFAIVPGGAATSTARKVPSLLGMSAGGNGPAEGRCEIYGGGVDVRPDKVIVLADLAESAFNLDMRDIEEARESAARMLQEGVPEDQNREAQLALRRAELGARIHRRIQGRGSVLRILDQDAEDAE